MAAENSLVPTEATALGLAQEVFMRENVDGHPPNLPGPQFLRKWSGRDDEATLYTSAPSSSHRTSAN